MSFERTYPSWPPLDLSHSIKRGWKKKCGRHLQGRVGCSAGWRTLCLDATSAGWAGTAPSFGQHPPLWWDLGERDAFSHYCLCQSSPFTPAVWGRNNERRGKALRVKVTLWTLIADSFALSLMLPEGSVVLAVSRGILWESLNLCFRILGIRLVYNKIFLVILQFRVFFLPFPFGLYSLLWHTLQ